MGSAAQQDCGGIADEQDDSSRVLERPSRRGSKALQLRSSGRRARKAGDQPDIFREFINSKKAERDAILMAKNGGADKDDHTKRLHQTHRLTKLMLEQSTDDDLKEKRYTKTGHQVFMTSMLKENKSRSDPALLSHARKVGSSPETLEVKKMYSMLYVKPATPEPVVVKKELVQAELAGQIGGLFGSKKPNPSTSWQSLPSTTWQ